MEGAQANIDPAQHGFFSAFSHEYLTLMVPTNQSYGQKDVHVFAALKDTMKKTTVN